MGQNRKAKFKPPPPLLPPLGSNAQPFMKAGVQLSDAVWLQEYFAGIRDRQIAQRLRQDTTISRYEELGEERIRATNHNRKDPEATERDWTAQAVQRAGWEEARSMLVGGVPVQIHHDENGFMYVKSEAGKRIYAPSLIMSTGTTCARFMNHSTASGRPVALYSPIKRVAAAKRTYKGGVRRVYFTQAIDNMPTDAYGKGYDEGLQFERDRLAAERLEAKATRNSPKVAEAPRVLNMDELVSAF